jgi:hypothetical protein
MNVLIKNKAGKEAGTASAPALRMKIFLSNDPKNTEQEVNAWLDRHSFYVHHIVQSQCERNGKLMLLVSVFYTGDQESPTTGK